MSLEKITDKDRLLMNIAIASSGTCHDKMMVLESGWKIRTRWGNPVPQFLPLELCDMIGMPLSTGDIIRCETNQNHSFSISKYIKSLGSHEYLCEMIGGKSLCRISNEMINVLRFMPKEKLYVGKEKQLYDWSYKAFSPQYNKKSDYYSHRCGGVDITGNTITIWSRAHVFIQEKKDKNGEILHAQPKKFVMEWNSKTRLKDIVNYINKNGFGKDYEYKKEEQKEGNGGMCKFTREDILKVFD